MPSSLAAALAASSKNSAASSSDNKTDLPSSSPRLSSLMKYQQQNQAGNSTANEEKDTEQAPAHKHTHEGKTQDKTGCKNNDCSKGDSNNGNDDDTSKNVIGRQQKATLNRKKKTHNNTATKAIEKRTMEGNMRGVPTTTTAVTISNNAAGGVVFVCDIPSDSDDDGNCITKEELRNVDEAEYLDNHRIKSTKKRGGKKKKGQSNNKTATILDADIINTPSTSEVVFLCDIPSDNSDNDAIDNDKNVGLDNNMRGKRGEKGMPLHNNSGRRNDARNTSRATSRTSNRNTTTVSIGGGGSNDRCTADSLPTISTGLMPTPWSTRQQAIKHNGIDNRNTNLHTKDSSRPNTNLNTKGMRSRNSFPTQERRSLPVRVNNCNPTPSSVTTATCPQSSFKLESTVLKGRWADEDSDSE